MPAYEGDLAGAARSSLFDSPRRIRRLSRTNGRPHVTNAGVPCARNRRGLDLRRRRYHPGLQLPPLSHGSPWRTGAIPQASRLQSRRICVSLADDLKLDRMPGVHVREREWDGIGRITNIVWLPNGKTDANNQHLAFISTDLPERKLSPGPTADWAWRDNFQERLRKLHVGTLLVFAKRSGRYPNPFKRTRSASASRRTNIRTTQTSPARSTCGKGAASWAKPVSSRTTPCRSPRTRRPPMHPHLDYGKPLSRGQPRRAQTGARPRSPRTAS